MARTRWGIMGALTALAMAWGLLVVPAPRATGADSVRAGRTVRAPAPDPRLERFQRQPIAWHGCRLDDDDEEGDALDEAGAECADITVPLDYTEPDRHTMRIAISRLRATDTANRIGPLFVNPGGPGNPVRAMVVGARQYLGEVGERFDLIGMDPRFVARSTPIDCGWPAAWLPRSAGADRAGFERMVGLSADLARRCRWRHGDVLPHATTANIARDMDVVRAALGDPELSYLGYSQGSYLGAVYTQLFPSRADRIVLDSAVDPTRPGTPQLRETGPSREAALREWAAWAATRDGEHHLGSTTDEVMATVHRVYQASARRPLVVGPHRIDDTLIAPLLVGTLTDDDEESNQLIAETVAVLVEAADSGKAESNGFIDATLSGLLTGSQSALKSQQTAILCGDSDVRRNPASYWRDIEAHRAAEPLFGPLGRTITPCAFWPAAKRPAVRIANAVPSLVVSAEGDINANIAMGRAMHRALTGSRLVTLEGVRTHGVFLFNGNECVDRTVGSYLATGELPPADLTCTAAG